MTWLLLLVISPWIILRHALHRLQVGVPPVAPHDALEPLLVPDDPSNPASHAQVKATAAQQRCAASGLPACISLAEASLAYPISKTSATGIPQKYLSKWLTALSQGLLVHMYL